MFHIWHCKYALNSDRCICDGTNFLEQKANEGNMSSLETYYTRSHEAYSKLVPYTFPVAIMLIITNKLALYCWNFMDLFLIMMCTALYMRIEKLGFYIEEKSRFHNHHIGIISN